MEENQQQQLPQPLDSGFFKYYGDMLQKWEQYIFPLFQVPSSTNVKYLEIEQVYDASYTNFVLNHLPLSSTATCIDMWNDQDDIYQQLSESGSGYILKRGNIIEEMKKLTDSYDLIFILSSGVLSSNLKESLELFDSKLLKKGGVLVINDFLHRSINCNHHAIDVVKKFIQNNDYKVLFSDFHLFLQKN